MTSHSTLKVLHTHESLRHAPLDTTRAEKTSRDCKQDLAHQNATQDVLLRPNTAGIFSGTVIEPDNIACNVA